MDRSRDTGAETRERLPAFDDKSRPDRYCDLILTGGITSAVAYPPAIFALASVYRFRSVGGASSGAGSAALAAAAEYRRRHGSGDGFRTLLERTAEIGDTLEGKTKLAWLFQPGPKKKRLFDLLVGAVTRPHGKTGGLGWGLFWSYFALPLIVAGLIVLAIGSILNGPHPANAFILGVVSSVGAVLAFVMFGLCHLWADVRTVLATGYGLCSGRDEWGDAPHPALTDWLHELIQEVAGRPATERPLTFADLEAAPGAPDETLGTCGPDDSASIKLQMFTSNLTLGVPRLFPLTNHPMDLPPGDPHADKDGIAVLYFLEAEMRHLFPKAVVDHMVAESQPYEGRAVALHDPNHPDEIKVGMFRRLPGKRLPIVVAARMSVSFPVLFEAVPLWVEYLESQDTCEGPHKPPTLRRCLFADGGFCSNFPIHLFDSAVPDWPTFGLTLRDLIPDLGKQQDSVPIEDQYKYMVESIRLPQRHQERARNVWHAFDETARPTERLSGFLSAMLATTKDWSDATLARLPGVRDRVVSVGLWPGIGGLNILMDAKQINALGRVGGEAARHLLDRFAKPSGPDGLAAGWNEHRWVRFNLLRDCLGESLAGFSASAAGGRFTKPLREQIDEAVAATPLEGDTDARLLAAQAAALQGVLAALQEAERALSAPVVEQPYTPKPRPNLRIRPPL